jgi:Cu2+-exporting ATPase
MMEAAEGAKSTSRRIADKAASVYAPVVHATALVTLFGWGLSTGDWHAAVLNAVAVLIITCPCALALAVPIAHVVAAGKLFERGILMKDGAALERVAEVDRVMFDKTGTLTFGRPRLIARQAMDKSALGVAAALARASSHPLSAAIAEELGSNGAVGGPIREVSGEGIEARHGTTLWRLGSARFCGLKTTAKDTSEVWLAADGTGGPWVTSHSRTRRDPTPGRQSPSCTGSVSGQEFCRGTDQAPWRGWRKRWEPTILTHRCCRRIRLPPFPRARR